MFISSRFDRLFALFLLGQMIKVFMENYLGKFHVLVSVAKVARETFLNRCLIERHFPKISKGNFLDSIENTKHESSVFKPFRSVSMINGNKFCSFTAQNLMKMRIFTIETSNHQSLFDINNNENPVTQKSLINYNFLQ